MKIYSPSTPCWISEYSTDTQGYAMKRINGKLKGLHRVIFEALHGPVPDGLELDHLCRTRACVNPAHLEPVTHKVNALRGVGVSAIAASKTHCKKGHILGGDNQYHSPSFMNNRACKTCIKERNRIYQARKRRSNGITPRKGTYTYASV